MKRLLYMPPVSVPFKTVLAESISISLSLTQTRTYILESYVQSVGPLLLLCLWTMALKDVFIRSLWSRQWERIAVYRRVFGTKIWWTCNWSFYLWKWANSEEPGSCLGHTRKGLLSSYFVLSFWQAPGWFLWDVGLLDKEYWLSPTPFHRVLTGSDLNSAGGLGMCHQAGFLASFALHSLENLPIR